MAGAGGAATTLTGTLQEDPYGCGCNVVTTAQGTYFHVHALLHRCDKEGDPRKYVVANAPPSERATISVGNRRLLACVTAAGLKQLLSRLLQFLPGLEDAVSLADALGIQLGDEATAASKDEEKDAPPRRRRRAQTATQRSPHRRGTRPRRRRRRSRRAAARVPATTTGGARRHHNSGTYCATSTGWAGRCGARGAA